VSVALVLLDAGADLESVEAVGSRSPLLAACLVDRPELVALLLARGANVKAVDNYGWTPTLGVSQRAFGREMIPLLVNAGDDILHKTDIGIDAMTSALFQSGAMAKTLSKFLPPNYKLERRYGSKTDPIGSMVVSAKFGKTGVSRDFSLSISGNYEPERCVGMLRNGLPLFLTNLKMMCSTRFQGTAV
jgi:hypothetical protein